MLWYPRSAPCDARPAAPETALWADPRRALAITAFRVQVVPGGITEAAQIAPADPKRVAIGFSSGPIDTLVVAPAGVDAVYGFRGTASLGSAWLWFDLYTHGVMVNEAWFTAANAGTPIAVYEIYRLQ